MTWGDEPKSALGRVREYFRDPGSLQQARVNMNAGLSGAPASVRGAGKIDDNVGSPSKAEASPQLFQKLNLRRDQQMTPSNSGPQQENSPFA